MNSSEADATAAKADARGGDSLLASASSAKGARHATTIAAQSPCRRSTAAARVRREVQSRRLNAAANAATRSPIAVAGSTRPAPGASSVRGEGS